jgi:predicted nucleic acid-binding protein
MSVRATLDSNILIYAALEPGTAKGKRATEVIQLATLRGILANQALLEFVAVVRRRAPHLTAQATVQAEAWAAVFETAPTTTLIAAAAHRLVVNHQIQVWDAVILCAAANAGATHFLSEDLQDGATLDGVLVMNPFTRSLPDIVALLQT